MACKIYYNQICKITKAIYATLLKFKIDENFLYNIEIFI